MGIPSFFLSLSHNFFLIDCMKLGYQENSIHVKLFCIYPSKIKYKIKEQQLTHNKYREEGENIYNQKMKETSQLLCI
jgi:hypothetical protein